MANSKSKRKPRHNSSRKGETVAKTPSQQDTPSIPPLNSDLKPVEPRPLLFTVSLMALIGWLTFLAFVAYRVTVS